MPRKIILVRHGETKWNFQKRVQGWTDEPLNAKGKFQAKLVSLALLGKKIDYIFSSDLARAYQTAVIIGRPHRLKVKKVPALKERMMGMLEGKTIDELEKEFGEVEKKWFTGTFDWGKYKAESNEKLEVRLRGFLTSLKKYKNKTVVLVAHGGVKRMVLEIFGFKTMVFKKVKLTNSCLTILEKEKNGNYEVKTLADYNHLRLG